VTLYDGAITTCRLSALAFEITGRGGMRECRRPGCIKLPEPIMRVEVVTPEDYLGDAAVGDLNSRRGQIQVLDSRGNAQVVEGWCLANMFGCR